MADNLSVTPGSGATVAADNVGGVLYQKVKIDAGGHDVSLPVVAGQNTMANSLPVAVASDQGALPATQSGTWNINNVSGTVSLPTGAATSAKQPALGTAGSASSDVITVQGITSMTALKVDGSAVTQPVSGTVSITANSSVNLNQVAGSAVSTGHGTASGAIRVELPTDGTGVVNAAQSGTWNINNVSGTVSLPTGASTAAKQPALGTAGSASSDVITVQGIASMTALKVQDLADGPVSPGAAATNSMLVGGVYNSSPPTLTNGQQSSVQFDSSGNLKINVASGSSGNAAAGSTGSAVPSSADYQGVTVGGTLTGVTGKTAGGATGECVDLNSVGGTALSLGQALSAASVPVVLPAAQITTLTPLSSVTVTQATGTNLHTVVDSGSISASQSGTWNINNVSGTVSLPTGASTAAKQPALGTAGSASSDVITVQGIASMTALKVDGSAVTQPVSGTVNAAQSGTWTVQPGNTANTTPWLVNQSDPAITSGSISVVDSGTTTVTNSINQSIITGTPTASSSVSATLSAQDGVTVQLSGTFNGTVAFERSMDGGTTFTTFSLEEVSIGAAVSSITISDNNPYIFRGSVGALSTVRVRCTARTSGTLTVKIQPGFGVGIVISNQGVPASSTNAWSVNAAQSGTWNINNVSGTVSLPTGASTAAKQPALGTAGSASSDVITVQGIASMTALKVDGSAVTQPVSGTVSITANSSVNLNQVAGSSVATGHGTAAGAIRVELPTDGTGVVNASQSGTWNINNVSGTVSLPTGASTAAKQPALGTAGSASSDVITVQGITSMTALKVDGSAVTQPVSGTVTVTQATGTNLHTVIDSGSVNAVQSGTWTVQPGNTPNTTAWLVNESDPAITSGSISVVDSGTTTVTNSISQSIITGTPTASSSVSVMLSAHDSITVQLSGTFNGTLAFERSIDGGTTFTTFSLEELSVGAAVNSIAISDNNPYIFRGNAGSLSTVRVRCTARTSGTLTVKIQPGFGIGTVISNQGVPASGAANAWLVSAAQSGTWNINNVSGTVSLPTGASTAAKQPALGTAGSASSDVITVQGITSMTALKVDGSAVTQPVSGTVTVIQPTGTNLHTVVDSGSINAVQSGTWTVQPGNTANTTPWLVNGSDPTITSGTISVVDAGTSTATNSINQSIITGTPTASSFVSATLSAQDSVTVQLSGTFNGTVAFERSIDGGTTFTTLALEELSIGAGVSSITISDNNPYIFRGNVGALSTVRVRCTARTSGGLLVKIQPSFGISTVISNQGVPASASNAWTSKVTDGTNTATVKAASTAAVASDSALVVGISPNNLPTSALLADNISNPTTTQIGANLLGWDATNTQWLRIRVPQTYKDQNAVSIGTITTVWTPTSGKKFRLMGGCISVSAAGNVIFEDNTAGQFIFRTPKLATDTPFNFDLPGGRLSASANNVLKATLNTSGNLTGTLWGTEE